MGIVLARVDNRLIHGQVAEGWLPALRPHDIIVVSTLRSLPRAPHENIIGTTITVKNGHARV